MPMRIKREKKLVRISPDGEMTIYQAAELKSAMLEAIHDDTEVEISLSDVSEMDTAGFQLLVLAKREAARRNKTLRLVAHSAATLGIMDLYNMAAYFGDPVVITN